MRLTAARASPPGGPSNLSTNSRSMNSPTAPAISRQSALIHPGPADPDTIQDLTSQPGRNLTTHPPLPPTQTFNALATNDSKHKQGGKGTNMPYARRSPNPRIPVTASTSGAESSQGTFKNGKARVRPVRPITPRYNGREAVTAAPHPVRSVIESASMQTRRTVRSIAARTGPSAENDCCQLLSWQPNPSQKAFTSPSPASEFTRTKTYLLRDRAARSSYERAE